MRYFILVVVYAVLFSGLAYGAPTVFFKDGTKEVGSSIWTENNNVYLSKSNEVYEYGIDEVKLDETLKYNKLGRYQVVSLDENGLASGTAGSKQRWTDRGDVTRTGTRPKKHASNDAAATAITPSVPVSAPSPTVAASARQALSHPSPATAPAVKGSTQPAATSSAPKETTSPPDAVPQPGSADQMKTGIPLFLTLMILAACLLTFVAHWIIFERAGQAGWKCLVPFYNMYILMEISGKPGWWMFLLFIPLAGIVFFLLAMLSLAKRFRKNELFGVGIFVLPMIFLPVLAFGGSEYEG